MKSKTKQLTTVFEQLSEPAQASLLDYAEFLLSREAGSRGDLTPQEPNWVPAKEGESVIQAVKRLSAVYHMLDKSKLLNETSVLVTEHTLQGRDRDEVIAELEVVFRQHYANFRGGEPT